MEGYTIASDCILPSRGEIYDTKVNPQVKLRSMTTEEEMKRLNYSDSPFKMLSEIIDDCLIEKTGIPTYDLHIGDYQYLMHRLRVATYGPEYPIETVCPICGHINNQTINLDELKVTEYDKDLSKYLNIVLPTSKKQIKLRLQTPRLLDWANRKAKEFSEKSNTDSGQSAFLFTLISLIETVDGQVYDEYKLETFVRKLSMKDTNYILQCAKKFDFGLNTKIDCKCSNSKCKAEYKAEIPITGEFFRPSID